MAVIFDSNRNGTLGIFKQALGGDTAEAIVTGPSNPGLPRVTPDGILLLYLAEAGENKGIRIMRVPITGGAPQLVLLSSSYYGHRCARSPATLCALAERTPDRKQVIFTALDPVKGRGHELTRIDVEPSDEYGWDLSPEGTRIAFLKISAGRIRILSLIGQAPQEIVVKGWNLHSDGFDWAADRKGFFVSDTIPLSHVLLYVDLQGNAHLLTRQKATDPSQLWGLPSPDGRHLAIPDWTSNSNVWMMENF